MILSGLASVGLNLAFHSVYLIMGLGVGMGHERQRCDAYVVIAAVLACSEKLNALTQYMLAYCFL